MSPQNIHLIPLSSQVSCADLRNQLPDLSDKKLIALDFPLSDSSYKEIRSKTGELFGFEFPEQNIQNYDHHAPVIEMARIISTTPLVTKVVAESGANTTDEIFLNHTDADSMLSALVLSGNLPHTDPRWDEAAIAADHTGAKNEIADLLNAVENKRDIVFSMSCLDRYIKGEPQSSEVDMLLANNNAQRQVIESHVSAGDVKNIGDHVYFIQTEKILRSEFFPSLIPDAAVFVIAGSTSGGYQYKVRLGQNAPSGMRLNQLQIPYLSGRWNAGGTIRFGPVPIPPQEYAELVRQRFISK